eukprot:Tbor_TRINITY_DN5777_c0_g1::TRINITY_DN5777_c0_g1_i1::g.20402::m.20402
MEYQSLEKEVDALNTEMTRLRLMVTKCMEIRESSPPAATIPYTRATVDPSSTRLPLPGDPMSVLPSIFSGMQGTARLLKVLLETYPWLLPSENENQLRGKKEKRNKQKKTRKPSSTTSESLSSSSRSSSKEDHNLPERNSDQRAKSPSLKPDIETVPEPVTPSDTNQEPLSYSTKSPILGTGLSSMRFPSGKNTLLSKIKALDKDDYDNDDDETKQNLSPTSSEKNSFVDETMKPDSDDSHDF